MKVAFIPPLKPWVFCHTMHKIEWFDYGEIREISPESAERLAKKFAEASVLARAQERSSDS